MATTTQIIFGGSADDPATTGTEYQCLMGGGLNAFSTSENNRTQIIPTGGTLQNFQVKVQTAPGTGKSWTFTIRVNGSNSALSVTIADTATASSVDTSTVAVSAGDRVVISAAGTGTPTAAAAVYWSCEWVPTTEGEMILLGNSGGNAPGDLNFMFLMDGKIPDNTYGDAAILIPTGGTLKKFYVDLVTAPGAGTSSDYMFMKNNGGTGPTINISGTATTGNDTTNTITIAAADTAVLQFKVNTGIPASSVVRYGCVFLPTTSGEFFACATTDDALNTAATEYSPLCSGDTTLTATESEQQQLAVSATTAKKIYVWMSADPGNAAQSDNYAFTLRRNGTTDTSLTVTVTADNVSGNAAIDAAISAGDLLSLKIVPGNVPSGAPKSQIAILFYTAPTGGTVTGTLSISLSALTNSGASVVPLAAVLTSTLATLTGTRAGVVPLNAVLSTSLAALSSSSAVQALIAAALSQSMAAATLSGAGVAPIGGTSTPSLGALGLTGAAVIPLNASGSLSLAALTSSATGTILLVGIANPSLGVLVLSADATSATTINAALDAALGALGTSFSGVIPLAGVADITLTSLTPSGAGVALVGGAASPTMDAVTATGAGNVALAAALAKTLDTLTSSGASVVALQAALAQSLGELLASTGATIPLTAVLTSDLGTLVLVGTAGNGATVLGGLDALLNQLTLAGAGGPIAGGTLEATLGGLGVVQAQLIVLEDGRMAVRAGKVYVIL